MDDTNKSIISEKEISLVELGKMLWKKRWFIVKASLIGLIIGIIVAFSIPKEYITTVILAPEVKSSGGGNGNIGALAAMAGVNLPQNTQDAISPELYPNIVSSTPFIVGLFDIKVKDQKRNIDTTLYTYLEKNQKSAWWSSILGAPFKLLGLFSSKEENIITQNSSDSKLIELTPEQAKVVANLRNRIGISVDKKTGVITLSSIMQSPEVSAYLADTVTSYLQDYIIRYRTQKARLDLSFTEKLYSEAKEDYYKAQQNYTTYSDKNLDIVSARYGATRERLQNEVTLAYTVYNQMAQQLQVAKVKVQDITPVYTIIQPSIIPTAPEKPKKKLIALGFIFAAFLGASFWVIIKNYFNLSFNKK